MISASKYIYFICCIFKLKIGQKIQDIVQEIKYANTEYYLGLNKCHTFHLKLKSVNSNDINYHLFHKSKLNLTVQLNRISCTTTSIVFQLKLNIVRYTSKKVHQISVVEATNISLDILAMLLFR